MKKNADVWNGIKNKTKTINNAEDSYKKDYMKIDFNTDEDLPLNKTTRISCNAYNYQICF